MREQVKDDDKSTTMNPNEKRNVSVQLLVLFAAFTVFLHVYCALTVEWPIIRSDQSTTDYTLSEKEIPEKKASKQLRK